MMLHNADDVLMKVVPNDTWLSQCCWKEKSKHIFLVLLTVLFVDDEDYNFKPSLFKCGVLYFSVYGGFIAQFF